MKESTSLHRLVADAVKLIDLFTRSTNNLNVFTKTESPSRVGTRP